jgi:hypothetical protein
MKKDSKTIKEKLAELFMLVKKESFLDAKAQDGSILRTADEAFKTGSQVVLISEDGTSAPAADGSYVLVDGSTLVIKSGVVETITPASPDATATPAPATTSANPTTDAPAAMADATAPDASAPSAAPADGTDMDSLISIIQNLVERVSALEASTSDTAMSVEKMAAAPAAAAFNSNTPATKGTVAEYLENYKKEHIAKAADLEKTKTDVLRGIYKKPTTQTFSKAEAPVVVKKETKKITLDWGRIGKH